MNITITGSLGNISRPLAQELIANGHDVTVISSTADRQAEIEALGARAAIGSIEDPAFLTTAFAGTDAVYAMTPPNFRAPDLIAYYRNVATAYASAVAGAGVRHIVYLSSYGADLKRGSGVILGSHYSERILSALEGVTVTFLRPGYFYTNLYSFTDMIKNQGVIATNYGGADKLLLTSALDIAAAAAAALTKQPAQTGVRYVVSDEKTCNEVAQAIGESIGQPALQWQTLTDEQLRTSMLAQGLPAAMTELLVELGAGIHNGLLSGDYEKQDAAPAPGRVKLADFAAGFATMFNNKQ